MHRLQFLHRSRSYNISLRFSANFNLSFNHFQFQNTNRNKLEISGKQATAILLQTTFVVNS